MNGCIACSPVRFFNANHLKLPLIFVLFLLAIPFASMANGEEVATVNNGQQNAMKTNNGQQHGGQNGFKPVNAAITTITPAVSARKSEGGSIPWFFKFVFWLNAIVIFFFVASYFLMKVKDWLVYRN